VYRAGLPAWVLNLYSIKSDIDRVFKQERPIEVIVYQCDFELDLNNQITRNDFSEKVSPQIGMVNVWNMFGFQSVSREK